MKFLPIVSVPPSGELIVTCRPVWAIEPITIGWPWSARIGVGPPHVERGLPCPHVDLTPPVIRAGKLPRTTPTNPWWGDRNSGRSWPARTKPTSGRAAGWRPGSSARSPLLTPGHRGVRARAGTGGRVALVERGVAGRQRLVLRKRRLDRRRSARSVTGQPSPAWGSRPRHWS